MKRVKQLKVDQETYDTIRKLQGEYIKSRREYISMLDIIRKKFNGEI